MKTIVGILAAVIASVTLPAADPPGFAIWKAADDLGDMTPFGGKAHPIAGRSSFECEQSYGESRGAHAAFACIS